MEPLVFHFTSSGNGLRRNGRSRMMTVREKYLLVCANCSNWRCNEWVEDAAPAIVPSARATFNPPHQMSARQRRSFDSILMPVFIFNVSRSCWEWPSSSYMFIGRFIPNNPLYVFEPQQCLFNNWMVVG